MKKSLVIGMIFLLLLAGCSRSSQIMVTEQQRSQESFSFNWKTQTFQMAEKVTTGKQLQMKTYREWEHGEQQAGNTYFFRSYASDGTSFFTGVEECVYTEDLSKMLSVDYYKEAMNPVTGEIESSSITEEEFHVLFSEPKEAGLLPPIELYTSEDSQISVWGVTYSDDGEFIYAVYNQEENIYQIKWYDEEVGKERVLGEIPIGEFRRLLGMCGVDLYYATLSELVCWNVLTGERENIFSFADNGIMDTDTKQLAFREDDTLYLRCISDDEDWMTELTSEEIVTGEAVSIADISRDGTYRNIVGETAAVFSRKNPQYILELEKNETDEEAYRTRVLADVTAGKGPDILLVNRSDMKLLYEKGWTADLKEYISEETLSELLPGVIKMGTVEETLVGLAPEVSVRAMFTNRSIWDKDSWTLSEIIELLAKNKNQKNFMVDYYKEEISGELMLWNFALWDLESSLFIDWEKRTSNFDREEFVTLLKMFKECEESTFSADEKAKLLQEGKCLALYTPYMWCFKDFVEMADMAGEDFYPIGFPSEAGSANYLEEHRILVVNGNTKNKQVISDFLEYLFSQKAQADCVYYSVRRNSLEEAQIRKSDYEKDKWSYRYGKEKGSLTIISKSDVKAYVKVFNTFLEKCEPVPQIPETLESILWEELDAYFGGDKTAEDTAKIIDNRVQLYLDENK